MKTSRRAKRMKKQHSRSKATAALNMVSLMDIFTILVFFLLVNATSAEVLPSPQNITLPESSTEKRPERNLVIAVDATHIKLQGKIVATVDSVKNSKKSSIKPLFDALKLASLTVKDLTDKKGVTIMGDKKIPYDILKKVMLTCAGAEFTNISFAVNQTSVEG